MSRCAGIAVKSSNVIGGTTQAVELKTVLALLATGEIEMHGVVPWSSNYTFLVTVRDASRQVLAIYKPGRGERPLWDFPRGTLCRREYATYLVSEALGWSLVPPTVLRDGPHGPGAVQLYIDADPDEHYFTLRHTHRREFQRLTVFDALINNTDRKGGHCLKDKQGRIWAIDHGVTFHAEPKLRTVIWDFRGRRIPQDILDDLRAFRAHLADASPLMRELVQLLAPDEISALRARLAELLERQTFPEPDPGYYNVPWPLV